jgi:hypothetical protein
MFAGSLGYITSLVVVATTFIVCAPQFNVSIANFAVNGAKQKVEQCQHAFESATDETKEFWQTELKSALVDYASAIDSAFDVQSKNVVSAEELTQRKTALQAREIDNLQSSIETKIAQIDLAPTVPMWGIMTVLGGLMLFIASHAFGQGACIWVFIGEIFPNKVRAQGQALGSFVHWILAAVVSMLFPPLLSLLGPGCIFLLFAGFMFLQLLWVLFLMPETKQVSLEEMQKKLGIE